MRNAIRHLPVLIAFLGFLSPAPGANPFSKPIEAVKGKRYTLTKAHGPWMIMVASVADPPPDRREEGMSAAEAADALVLELRQRGLPAYVVQQSEATGTIDTIDRLGRPRQSNYKAQRERLCVIAGNYKSIEDPTAQRTLEQLKSFHPKCWEGHASYHSTPGRPGPLSGAFITVNPLLSPEELAEHKRDPLLLRLNSGAQFSLFENPGRYSLIVASFYGRSQSAVGEGKLQRVLEAFTSKDLSLLDQAGEDAWQVATLLNNHPKLKERGVSAYVLHERYRSIVTVGAFDSPDDPLIPILTEMFRAKVKVDPVSGRKILTGENISAPWRKGGQVNTWTFDPEPMLVAVPRDSVASR